MNPSLTAALAALEKRDWSEAAAAAQKAHRAQRGALAPLLVWTEALLGAGDGRAALKIAQDAVRTAPQRAEATLLLARSFQVMGDMHHAVAALERSLQQDDAQRAAWTLMREFRAWENTPAGEPSKVDAAIQRQLAPLVNAARAAPEDRPLQQRYLEVLGWLSNDLLAVEHYQWLLERFPQNPVYLNNLASRLRFMGRTDEAREAMKRALAICPEDGGLWLNLGELEKSVTELDAAIAALTKATEISPEWAQAWFSLASAHYDAKDMDAAFAAIHRGLELAPTSTYGLNVLGIMETAVGHAEAAVKAHAACRAADPFQATYHSNYLLSAHYAPSFSVADLAKAHFEFAAHHPATRSRASFGAQPDPRKRLRVGFVSADFCWHSVAYFLEGVWRHLDPSRLELVAYSRGNKPDDMTAALKRRAHVWRDVSCASYEDIAKQMRADALDIAVDLGGHTGRNCLAVFGWRVAPVQVSWLGYPDTTGLKTMDYRLVDAETEPPAQFQSFSAEKLVCLPEGFHAHRIPGTYPEVEPVPALGKGYITFGSFNNAAKLNPPLISLWARLLRAVPDSRLLLKNKGYALAQTCRELKEAFAAEGIAANRLEFVTHTRNTAEHLEQYGRIDIALDPSPYNGTTTTIEALTMGVPVLALRGDRHCARVSASLLSQVGLPEWIAEDADAFVAQGAKWASDLALLVELRNSLRAKLDASPLHDYATFATKLTAAFRTMWIEWCDEQGVEVATAQAEASPTEEALAELARRRRCQAWADRGCELLARGYAEDAAHALRGAVGSDPERPGVWTNLAVAEERAGHWGAAQQAIAEALRLAPDFAPALTNRARLAKATGDLESALADYTTAFKAAPDDSVVRSNLLYCLPFLPGLPQTEIDDHHTSLAPQDGPVSEHPAPWAMAAEPSLTEGPLRVGYVTPDVTAHPICDFLGPVLRHHDPEDFAVTLYALRRPPDAKGRAWAGEHVQWVDLSGWPDEAIAAQWAKDAPDVLVDLAGHTSGSRPALFATRHAPVQISWLGYPGKTGCAKMDYTVGDATMFPDDDAQVWRLPDGVHCFAPVDQPTNISPARETGPIIFGAPHQLAKVNAVTLELWAQVLAAVPHSQLAMRAAPLGDAEVQRVWRERLQRYGIDPKRVTFSPWDGERAARWRWWQGIDLMLDAWPYHGTTTTCEALCQGIPVVTMRGDTTASRVGPSLLTSVARTAWIAEDPARYVACAAELVADRTVLARERARLAMDFARSSLGAAPLFTRQWESALRKMQARRKKALWSTLATAV